MDLNRHVGTREVYDKFGLWIRDAKYPRLLTPPPPTGVLFLLLIIEFQIILLSIYYIGLIIIKYYL